MMIDPLLLGSGAAYSSMHAPEMPRSELMYAMNGMHLLPEQNNPIPSEYANMPGSRRHTAMDL
jgi:hypothetical protein